MPLEFRLNALPPTCEEIARAREEARLERAQMRRQNIRFLIVILLLVAAIMTIAIVGIIPQLDNPNAEPDVVGLFAYLTPYMFLTVFVVGNTLHHQRIEKPRKVLEARMAELGDASVEELDALESAPPYQQEVMVYRERLKALGRPPVRTEVQMMLAPDAQATR
ncbi:MAG: hypothetical protein LBV36_06015 [Chromatiales bacterium]|jgi:hypothetical protein|nr:hypothetical protein [Chromatiales bacterium]